MIGERIERRGGFLTRHLLGECFLSRPWIHDIQYITRVFKKLINLFSGDKLFKLETLKLK